MKIYLILLFFGIISTNASRDGYVYYPEIGVSYKFSYQAMSWDAVVTHCEAENARIAMPKTQRELDVLVEIFKTYPPSPTSAYPLFFLAGYHDFFVEDVFIDLYDHKPLPSFLKWLSGEPNDKTAGLNQDCGAFHNSGAMADYPCQRLGTFFCQRRVNTSEYRGDRECCDCNSPPVSVPHSTQSSSLNVGDLNIVFMIWGKNVTGN